MIARFGQFEKAKFYLDRGMDIDSTNYGLISNLTMYYEGVNKFNEAEKQYKKLIALDSIHAPYSNIGVLYANYGRLQEAELYFRKAVQQDSTSDWAFRNLGYSVLLRGGFAEAELILLKAIELDPLFEDSYLILAEIYKRTNRPAEEKKQYLKMIELMPDINDPWQMYHAGRAWLGLGNHEEMQRCIDESIQRWPNDATVYFHVGRLYAAAGQEKAAIDWFEKSILKGFTSFNWILYDPELAGIRKSAEYKSRLLKYFPKRDIID